jgi:transposase InsO family protein
VQLIGTATLDQTIKQQQKDKTNEEHQIVWQEKYPLTRQKGHLWNGTALVMLNPEEVQKSLLETYHDGTTAGHPGQIKTYLALRRDYWWPNMKKFITQYIQGCATCQENKPIMRRNNLGLYPITLEEGAQPFQMVAMDLIVKLPKSQGYDSILTITDHDCTKGVILVPCSESMGAKELAQEYKQWVFPFVGIPLKIISDRDTRFTSHFAKEVCTQLQIKQNISTAYHPQTDGQSEKMNQHVETMLRIICNYQQTDWADYLPMVQYMINARVSETTKKTPFELWMGHVPRAHQPERPSQMPRIAWHETRFKEARKEAQEAIKRAQNLWVKGTRFKTYQKDDQVWLEAKNLQMMHPTTKLRPKRYGPFRVTEAISPVTYRLDLPAQCKIHNAFHTSLLHPYKEMEAYGMNYARPLPDIIEGQEEWEVEKVLDSHRRGKKKKLQYLLKWKGFPEAENTWEYEEDISAQDLIKEYLDARKTIIRTLRVQKDDEIKGSSNRRTTLPRIQINVQTTMSDLSPTSTLFYTSTEMLSPPPSPSNEGENERPLPPGFRDDLVAKLKIYAWRNDEEDQTLQQLAKLEEGLRTQLQDYAQEGNAMGTESKVPSPSGSTSRCYDLPLGLTTTHFFLLPRLLLPYPSDFLPNLP